MSYAFWLLVHLLGVIVWVGGMFFARFCLRPAGALTLESAQRLQLWDASLAIFLRYAALAVVAVLVSGGAMLAQVGMHNAPLGWHLMLGLGLLMGAVFVYVYAYLYPKLGKACQAGDWALAARALDRIRHMVEVNLGLFLLTLFAALLVR